MLYYIIYVILYYIYYIIYIILYIYICFVFMDTRVCVTKIMAMIASAGDHGHSHQTRCCETGHSRHMGNS